MMGRKGQLPRLRHPESKRAHKFKRKSRSCLKTGLHGGLFAKPRHRRV